MTEPATSLSYRADIDGLRSIAIVSVVIFHAFPSALPTGFVGVDIFFVISGYLISSLILRDHSANGFSLARFYRNRVRRLFPGLVLVLTATTIAAGLILYAPAFRTYGWHVFSSVLFFQNFTLLGESGYFGQAAQSKPLLHLWSLAVEEQFYLVWPLLLIALRRGRGAALNFGMLVIALASLIWLRVEAPAHPVATFFLPVGRFWEFLAGAWAARRDADSSAPPTGWTASTMSLLGLALLVLGFFVSRGSTALQGLFAGPPVFGAALLIAAGPNGVFNRLLAHAGFVYVGRVSYVWYLWHWPALSLLAIALADDNPHGAWRMAAVLLSLLAAMATYHFVETPIRNGSFGLRRLGILVSGMAILGAAGLGIFCANGLPGIGLHDPAREAFVQHFDISRPNMHFFEAAGLSKAFRLECDFYDLEAYRQGHETNRPLPQIAPSCTQRDQAKSHVLLIWGDSHAQQFSSGLTQTLPPDWQVLQVASSGCTPAFEDEHVSEREYCSTSNRQAVTTIAAVHPDVVLIAQRLHHNAATMRHIADVALGRGAGRVIYAGPVPTWRKELPDIVVRRLWPNPPRYNSVGLDVRELAKARTLKSAFATTDRIAYADIVSALCNDNGCLTYVGDDLTAGLVSWDYGHLTPPASTYVAQQVLLPLVLGN